MRLNPHYELEGRHASFSPSNYHWSNYDLEKLAKTVISQKAARLGDALHVFASMAIRLNQKMPNTRKTLNMYVNDAIGFRMVAEQPLYYSESFFGTADAVGFKLNFLRIHDLKTGVTRTNMRQLEIYAALFCLEYGFKPQELDGIELRIYKSDDVEILIPGNDDILRLMDIIVTFNQQIEKMRAEDDS